MKSLAYNDVTGRTDAGPLIPEEVQREIIQNVIEQSAALRLFRQVSMSSKTQRMPVLSALVQAYFVNGDTGLVQTTKMAWENKYLNAEPLAAIVPVPRDVLDDSEYDLWGEIRPRVEEALALKLDEAVLFSLNKPATWPEGLVGQARAAGNVRDNNIAQPGEGGIAEDFNQLMGKIEEDGFDVDGAIARTGLRVRMRGARDTTGQALVDLQNNQMYGAQLEYLRSVSWPNYNATGPVKGVDAIVGDFQQGILATRKDITTEISNQSVITDNTGAVVLNLFQQRAVALLVEARFAFQVPNPITREQPVAAARSPFGVLERPA